MTKVGFIGVGKLGQPCAEVMAQYYDVVGFDLLERKPENFEMVNSLKQAVRDRDIVFVAIQTPHDKNYDGSKPSSNLPPKDFDYEPVKNCLSDINKHLTKKQLVVLISTVLPGTVRKQLAPLITNGRFIYNPYLIAMGTVKHDMVKPEMIIIGTQNGEADSESKELIDFYQPLLANDNTRFVVGTWEEAESTKIFYNTFISAKLSLVNMIQDVAQKLGNMNVDVVTQALADSTQRIMGPKYMIAGMGDGGSCHPRDNIALRYLANDLDLGYDLFHSIMEAREKQAENLAKFMLNYPGPYVILGKAYKPNVPYTDGSYSILVGNYIEEHGNRVLYFDPRTGDTPNISEQSATYLVGFYDEWTRNLKIHPGSTVIDPWRKWPKSSKYSVIHYGDTRNV